MLPRINRVECACVPIVCALLVSACGFQMRGARTGVADIEAERIYIDQTRAANLADEVKSQLKFAGVKVTESPADAEYVVLLANETVRRDVLSVSPRTGKVEEYQLTLSARMSLREAGGSKLLEDDPLSLVRDFTYDQSAALGKFSEEETLRDELTREAAELVLRRVGAVLANRK